MDSKIILTWVCDPYYPEVLQKYRSIIAALESNFFQKESLIENPIQDIFLYTEFQGYDYIKGYDNDVKFDKLILTNTNNIGKIQEMISEISLNTASVFYEYEYNINIEIFENLKSLVQGYASYFFNVKVDNVLYSKEKVGEKKYIYKFIPYCKGNLIYAHKYKLYEFINICNLNKLQDYKYITSDPLVSNVLKLYNYTLEYNNLLKKGDINVKEINSNIEMLLFSGAFSLANSIQSFFKISDHLYDDIAFMFGYVRLDELIYKKNIENKYLAFNDVNFFKNCQNDILHGNLPEVMISGEWKYENIDRLDLWYASILTYAHLIEKYNYLNRYISKVKVIDNLNILCNLVSIEQINEFITYLQEILKYKSNWKSVKIKNINEGYFYRKKLPADAKALILSDEYTNEYVIGYFDTLPPYKKIKSGPFDVYKWRGFYSSSSIKGLIDKPYRIYVSPNYGFLEYYNNENNYKVVVNQNEYKIDLFDIKLEKEDLPILKETCNLLWENGYFLTEWSTAMFLLKKKLSNYYKLDTLILRGNQSIKNGKETLSFLKKQNETFIV